MIFNEARQRPSRVRAHGAAAEKSVAKRVLAAFVALSLLFPSTSFADVTDDASLPSQDIPGASTGTTDGSQSGDGSTGDGSQGGDGEDAPSGGDDSGSGDSGDAPSSEDGEEPDEQDPLNEDEEVDEADEDLEVLIVPADELAQHVVPGLDPASTTVNLFDYDTGRRSGETVGGAVIGGQATLGTDTIGTTGTATAWRNYMVWLNNPDGINYGRLLTFGDGMRHLGYWNQGLVQAYGELGLQHPGMQSIVSPMLSGGYPYLTNSVNPPSDPSWSQTGNYDAHTALYADANGGTTYANAGNKNISNATQYLAVNPGHPNDAPENTAIGGGQNLSQSARSLQYLFDPSVAVTDTAKKSYRDVGGLFQIDDEGYYYYNMRKNFAHYDQAQNKFVLYDAPAGLRTDGTNSVGNFFPFNSPEHAFSLGADGQLVNALNANNDVNVNAEPVNHHLGLTMETDFRQPVNGKVGSDPMTFEFIGDDDLWIFIDDVLVMDLGGIHSELFGTIDFSTGDVKLGTAFNGNGTIDPANAKISTSIKEMFDLAGQDTSTGFTGNTFSSNTSHTLKMFYLERGNYDSSLAMRFNLQPELYQQIKKVDQDGVPVEGASFDLYPVTSTTATSADAATFDNITWADNDGSKLTSITTGADGTVRFMNGDEPFNFADRVTDDVASQLYVLRESRAPDGYRMMPSPLLLRYDRQTGTFVVNNRYGSGSYASFNSYVNQISNERLAFGAYNMDTGHIESTDNHVPLAQQSGGLVVAIPTIRQPSSAASRWDPLYGSNNGGLETVSYDVATGGEGAMRDAMLRAMLYQAYLSSMDVSIPGWYLNWDSAEQRLRSYYTETAGGDARLVCTLSDLPGTPNRYVLNNADGDMQMVYGIVSAQYFGADLAQKSAAEKYDYLAQQVRDQLAGVTDPSPAQLASAVNAVAAAINASPTAGAGAEHGNRGFSAIDTSDGNQFVRDFRTVINIPNEQRELRVWKVDQNDNRVNGAVFALFDTRADAAAAADADVSADGVVTRITSATGGAIATVAAGITGDLTGAQNKYQGDDLEGMLVFAPYVSNGPGGAHTTWNQGDQSGNGRVVYLKEVKAPTGFEPNDTIIPVVIGQYGIYADAGNAFDGVDVLAGVGKLATTMSKYAASPHVNLTLRYITSTWQSQPSSAVPTGATSVPFSTFNAGWSSDESKQMYLIYGENAIIDYGSPVPFTDEQISQGIGYIDAEGRDRPLFRTSTGFIRTGVSQDTDAMRAAQASGEFMGIGGDDLSGQSLTNLFMIRNTVRVTDTRHAAPQVKKVDQDGMPIEGAEFQLYAVNAPAGVGEGGLADVTLEQVAQSTSATPLARLSTDATGTAEFIELDASGNSTGKLVDFSARSQALGLKGGRLYVLRETKAPAGYRQMLSDLLLRFEPATSMFVVNNRYETGATGSFASFVTVDADIHYASYANGSVTPGADTVDGKAQQEGLIVAVPLIQNGTEWHALYGDIMNGYQASQGTDEKAVLEAALHQAANGKAAWHLDWNSALGTLTGYIEGLPGTADRYRLKNPNGDMQMVYACISPEALESAGLGGISETTRRYEALGAAAAEDAPKLLSQLMAVNGGFRIIDASDLDRNFQALVYVPNEIRELRLWKVDPEGNRRDGAVFALFEDRTSAEQASLAVVEGGVVTRIQDGNGNAVRSYASGVTGLSGAGDATGSQHGALVFAPNVADGAGSAHTMWIADDGSDLTGRILYLKEVQAPEHYLANETIIPVVVGRHGIYADAGTEGDGVDVLAGAGKLAAPLHKFAASPEVNLTLRYLTSLAQVQPSLSLAGDDPRIADGTLDFGSFNDEWEFGTYPGDDGRRKQMELLFGESNAIVDYGHPGTFTEEELLSGVGFTDAYGVQRPLFVTDTGFLRTYLEQDSAAMKAAQAEGPYAGVRGDDLAGQGLIQLFTIENTVRIVDEPDPDNPPPPEEPEVPNLPGTPPGQGDYTSSDFPNTGDTLGALIAVLIAIAALAGAALIMNRDRIARASLGAHRISSGSHAKEGAHGRPRQKAHLRKR